MELLAAIAGTYYLRQRKATKYDKYLVAFLWFIVIAETVGIYAPAAYFSKYKYFSFVEGTLFTNNYWIFNIVIIASFAFYSLYFRSLLRNGIWKKTLSILVYLYVLASILFLIFTDIYFSGYSKFSSLAGTLLLFISVAVFYFKLLKSDIILNLRYYLPIYISIGVLVFHLCVTPFDILTAYFKADTGNDMFIKLRVNVLLYSNIFMYSTIILGFIVCSRKKKSY